MDIVCIICNCNAYNLLFSWEDNDRNKININLVTKTGNMYVVCGLLNTQLKYRENHKTSEMNFFLVTLEKISSFLTLALYAMIFQGS